MTASRKGRHERHQWAELGCGALAHQGQNDAKPLHSQVVSANHDGARLQPGSYSGDRARATRYPLRFGREEKARPASGCCPPGVVVTDLPVPDYGSVEDAYQRHREYEEAEHLLAQKHRRADTLLEHRPA